MPLPPPSPLSAESDSPGREIVLCSQQVNNVSEVVGPIDSSLQQQEGEADDIPSQPCVVLHDEAVFVRCCNSNQPATKRLQPSVQPLLALGNTHADLANCPAICPAIASFKQYPR